MSPFTITQLFELDVARAEHLQHLQKQLTTSEDESLRPPVVFLTIELGLEAVAKPGSYYLFARSSGTAFAIDKDTLISARHIFRPTVRQDDVDYTETDLTQKQVEEVLDLDNNNYAWKIVRLYWNGSDSSEDIEYLPVSAFFHKIDMVILKPKAASNIKHKSLDVELSPADYASSFIPIVLHGQETERWNLAEGRVRIHQLGSMMDTNIINKSGDSGSPIIDLRGKVVGIVCATKVGDEDTYERTELLPVSFIVAISQRLDQERISLHPPFNNAQIRQASFVIQKMNLSLKRVDATPNMDIKDLINDLYPPPHREYLGASMVQHYEMEEGPHKEEEGSEDESTDDEDDSGEGGVQGAEQRQEDEGTTISHGIKRSLEDEEAEQEQDQGPEEVGRPEKRSKQ